MCYNLYYVKWSIGRIILSRMSTIEYSLDTLLWDCFNCHCKKNDKTEFIKGYGDPRQMNRMFVQAHIYQSFISIYFNFLPMPLTVNWEKIETGHQQLTTRFYTYCWKIDYSPSIAFSFSASFKL